VNVQTYGPIDILGFDVRHVVRTEPREFTPNFEPNYLAGIEFDEPDLPWLFTPASPAGDRIRPWFVLIVLKADEFTPVPGAPLPLPAIDVGNVGACSPSTTLNWAHTQVSGDGGLAGTMSAGPGERDRSAALPASARPCNGVHGVPCSALAGRPARRAGR
jgi:hypothetical protein